MRDTYDVVVIGGGPAGCTAAALVAEAGRSVLLLERESMPRFHVGESLMPECYWPLKRLGLIDKMKQSDFVRKKSVQFVTASGKESSPFYFEKHDPRECSTTWQVERADFDQMLWDRAGQLGAECLDQTRVLDVLLDDVLLDDVLLDDVLLDDEYPGDERSPHEGNGCVHRVKVRTADGDTRQINAKVVMDGSGQQSLIANKLGLREDIPNLKKSAIWTYYKNARRDEGDNAGATIIMLTEEKDSWFWFIPLSNDITSIGCTADSDYLLKTGMDSESRFNLELDRCPGLRSRLDDAERVDKIHVVKEYSYWTKRHAGDGWILIGDAFGFIDPLYSSGVYFALVMGEKAADSVINGFEKDDLSAAQLGNWCESFKTGARLIHKLVNAFYTKEFSFGGFVRDNPQCQGNLTDLLIGRIFHDGAGDIFEKMDAAVERSVATR